MDLVEPEAEDAPLTIEGDGEFVDIAEPGEDAS